MKSQSPLLILAFISVAACGTNGGVDSILGQFDGATTLDGTWIQQRLLCDGVEVPPAPGESTAMTLAGQQLVLNNSFDLGGGKICDVRTHGKLNYLKVQKSESGKDPKKSEVAFKFGESVCSTDCQPAMCAGLRGQIPPPAAFVFELNEPALKMSTDQGSTMGCPTGKSMVVELQRQ